MQVWRPMADGITVRVKVQPKSRRSGIQGRGVSGQGRCLRIGVNEPAEDGRANRAACRLLADGLRVAASAVAVTSGQTSRDKTLHVAGDVGILTARLETL